MATLETIRARIAKLEAQAASVAARQSSGALEKIRDLMEKHGLVIADLEAHFGKKRGRKPSAQSTDTHIVVAAKYRDPKTGATWSGRGRAPAWIASVKDRTKFEVAAGSSSAAPKTKAVAKAGHYVRGPQPALYRDPKTGATWSGRGRAPAWIADVKDRKKFLIAGAGDSAASSASSASSGTVPAKKVTTRKAVAKKATTKSAPAAKKAVRTRTAAAKKATPKTAAAKAVTAKRVTGKKAPGRKAETVAAASAVAVDQTNAPVAASAEE
ncbi:hypothetical protein DID96_37010 [Burkholderia sp. Bp8963]|uniref:H-NS family nucleoid-associated regulatory protein n=1 Tax=Burkholderia sp. Bp8963 TaxID=2184547 RepID=UPI000F59DB56|nr:H-NS family nucleoid-associated regulatory protein [Burkholderia sp. Bp8963]RQS56878.1 hypothetical protein DID96_37010 [Burkholderia sp. Bp8963]